MPTDQEILGPVYRSELVYLTQERAAAQAQLERLEPAVEAARRSLERLDERLAELKRLAYADNIELE